jgi:uncharacterized protein YndB with AHSA1/START domain
MTNSVKDAATLLLTMPSEREIAMTRVFDAPRRLVFDALTKPELVKRWLGVRGGWSMPVCEIDLRVGGALRYVWRKDSKGLEMGMRGVFREVAAPERFVHTETFDDPWFPGEALDTTVLIEEGGKTTLTTTVLYESQEIRDGVLKSGMERGVAESYDMLADCLASIA